MVHGLVHGFDAVCGKESWSPYLCCGHSLKSPDEFCKCVDDNPVAHHEKRFGKDWRKLPHLKDVLIVVEAYEAERGKP